MPRLLIVGLDEPQITELKPRLNCRIVAHSTLPRILVRGNELWVEPPLGAWPVPVDAVAFHGIFEDDLEFLAGLALWGGPCYPNALGLMDCRLRLPCLVRANRLTRFPIPGRGFASAGIRVETNAEVVVKWGNWHCGENKLRQRDSFTPDQDSIIEPFVIGSAVRVLVVGTHAIQFRLAGGDWLQSIHHPNASLMPLDPRLADDTRAIAAGVGLEVAATDYLIDAKGNPYLLELNHVPNVTRFPEAWDLWSAGLAAWLKQQFPTET